MRESFKVKINENNHAILYCGSEQLKDLGSAEGKNAKEIEELANFVIETEFTPKEEECQIITKDKQFMADQKTDLMYVRTQMIQIMKKLADPNVSMAEKKANLSVYTQMNNMAKTVVSACLTEIAIDKITPVEIEEIKQ